MRNADAAAMVEFNVTEKSMFGSEIEFGVTVVIEKFEAKGPLSGLDVVRAFALFPGVVEAVVVDDEFVVEVELGSIIGLYLERLRIPFTDGGVGGLEDESKVFLAFGCAEIEVGARDAALVDGSELVEVGELIPAAFVIFVSDVAEATFADDHFADHDLRVSGIGADEGMAVD